MEELVSKLKEAVISGEDTDARALVEEGLDGGMSPRDILERAMMPAMEDIGVRFSKGEAFIPELIVAAYAMEAGMEVLKPRMSGAGEGGGKVVLGTVAGDIHSIGKNLVRMCLEGAGFDVIDIGENKTTEQFVQAYKEHNPRILGLSALLSSTMLHMHDVILAVRAVDSDARIMVGGAPLTRDFADSIGATAYAQNAFEAAVIARRL
jgi:5-methyltetrahydrofolate--homocysteine methyltransferase